MGIKDKKGIEMTFQTVVGLIIALIVLIVMIFFFLKYGSGSAEEISSVGNEAIKNVVGKS